MADDRFWVLSHLSNEQLLTSLRSALCTKRRALADIVAHLAEVEERRLHLQAACSSLFYYCVQRLHMSEDEACRRIELARLARKFPMLFGEIAAGRISLSVALLLEPVLLPDNHAELLTAVRGASLQQARELLAARFPKPDIPTQLRKLPERAPIPAPSTPTDTRTPARVAPLEKVPPQSARTESAQTESAPPECTQTDPPSIPLPAQPHIQQVQPNFPHEAERSEIPHSESPRPSPQRIEPLSPGRYRVQFTAGAAFKHKLERARDLLRHAHPEGEIATILSRALDLLIEDVMKRRFGARRRSKETATPSPPVAQDSTMAVSTPTPPARASTTSPVNTTPTTNTEPPPPTSTTAWNEKPNDPMHQRPHIPRAAVGAVLERDGMGCSWVSSDGQRCGSTAWLEVDHRIPAGRGGSAHPDNLRLPCRNTTATPPNRPTVVTTSSEPSPRGNAPPPPPRRPHRGEPAGATWLIPHHTRSLLGAARCRAALPIRAVRIRKAVRKSRVRRVSDSAPAGIERLPRGFGIGSSRRPPSGSNSPPAPRGAGDPRRAGARRGDGRPPLRAAQVRAWGSRRAAARLRRRSSLRIRAARAKRRWSRAARHSSGASLLASSACSALGWQREEALVMAVVEPASGAMHRLYRAVRRRLACGQRVRA